MMCVCVVGMGAGGHSLVLAPPWQFKGRAVKPRLWLGPSGIPKAAPGSQGVQPWQLWASLRAVPGPPAGQARHVGAAAETRAVVTVCPGWRWLTVSGITSKGWAGASWQAASGLVLQIYLIRPHPGAFTASP